MGTPSFFVSLSEYVSPDPDVSSWMAATPLLWRQALNLGRSQATAQANLEADRMRVSWLPDLSTTVADNCLEEHLECVVGMEQNAVHAATGVRPVEQLDA